MASCLNGTTVWTNANILSIESMERNFDHILIKIHMFSFKKMHLKCKMLVILLPDQWVKKDIIWETVFLFWDTNDFVYILNNRTIWLRI